jgi:hypothetical protein
VRCARRAPRLRNTRLPSCPRASPRACTDSTQVPHITSIKTCSSVSLISRSARGLSLAFSSTKSAALVSAAGACGDAVANGVGQICRGLDPGISIVSAAQICANALAAVYSRTTSGALALPAWAKAPAAKASAVLNATELAGLVASQDGFYQACTASCNNAQSAAEALAQAAACGASKATDGCAAVTSEVKSEVFARAFTEVTTAGWQKACAQGSGAVATSSSAMAAAAAVSFASAIARVAARACAACPTCKCSKLPSIGGLNAAGRWSQAFATFAGGKVGVAKALAGASGALCTNGTVSAAKGATDAAMVAVASMVGSAVGSVRASTVKIGSASACTSATLATQLQVRDGGSGAGAAGRDRQGRGGGQGPARRT